MATTQTQTKKEPTKDPISIAKTLFDIFSVIKRDVYTTTKSAVYTRTAVDLDRDYYFLLSTFMRSSMFFIFIIIAAVFLYYASNDKDALKKNIYIYVIVILFPLLVGLYYTAPIIYSETGGSSTFLYLGLFGIVVCVLIYFLTSHLSETITGLLNALGYITFILIIVIGLAIFYYMFANYLKRQVGVLGFIIRFIFYIPCLVGDILSYIKEQFKITPNIVFIMFFIEVILLIIYCSTPAITDYILKKNATILMMDPIFLANSKVVATSETFILATDKSRSAIENITYRDSNYSVSFWVYINPSSSANLGYVKESEIFNYAGGKPRMTFVCDGINHVNTATIYLSNNGNENAKFENIAMPMQKWNYVVFNYYNNTADFLLNGVLTRSMQFTDNNMPLSGSDTDTISVGEKNGIIGAICNVNYYRMPLPLRQITDNYNLLMSYNPPVIMSRLDGNTNLFKFGKFDYFSSSHK